ncbi:MAG: hypothetical protein RLY43_1868 [Bacteroidota bacterium]
MLCVYKIIDSLDNKVVYVGSTKNIDTRRWSHFSNVYYAKITTKLAEYMREVCPERYDAEKRFTFVKIVDVPNEADRPRYEDYWYSFYKKDSDNKLLNMVHPSGYRENKENVLVPHVVDENNLFCRCCGTVKSKEDFHVKSEAKTGRQTYCKNCQLNYILELKAKKEFNKVKNVEKLIELGVKPICSKICKCCNKLKAVSKFNICVKHSDGLQSNCIDCNKKIGKEYRLKRKNQDLTNLTVML